MATDELYGKQISITEWFANIKHEQSEKLREEEAVKRERLVTINTLIDLPFDKPHSFSANDIAKESFEFKQFVREHGKELCALTLTPRDTFLPTLKIQNESVMDAWKWFREQKIDLANYMADFVPHPETSMWSTIFVVNNKGIFGEIIRGEHHQLTQGVNDGEKPITFSFDLHGWTFSENRPDVREHVQEVIRHIKVDNQQKRWLLEKNVGATFLGNYMRGYFETVKSAEFGTWFIDYNKTLGDLYGDFVPLLDNLAPSLVKGRVASNGKAKGRVRFVSREDVAKIELGWGDILICDLMTSDYSLLMQHAGGIITSEGGMLSHAAIVARELRKPCVVGVGDTSILREGEMIELDADTGIVKRI
jgi:phosphohistidine swiveling domain-containing protein